MTEKVGLKFLEKTKYEHMGPSDQSQEVPQPLLEMPFDAAGEVFDLPAPEGVDTPLRELIAGRKSTRSYANAAISQLELSYMLWATQGIRELVGERATKRSVPSAGARHAFETYLLANRVDGMAPGLYRYMAFDHKLAEFIPGDEIADQVRHASLDQLFLRNSAVTFLWVCDVYRMTWRYRARGYRYLFMDAGHVCQNLYLAAESIGCGACAVGAFDDDLLNDLLGLDGENQFVVYMGAVGKKKP